MKYKKKLNKNFYFVPRVQKTAKGTDVYPTPTHSKDASREVQPSSRSMLGVGNKTENHCEKNILAAPHSFSKN